MKVNPLISIITASYNSAKTIEKTIQSVLDQTYINFEFIIIDGNSSDQTLRIIEGYESEFKKREITYKWISEPDSGIYEAFNKGLIMANGDWISFLGSDDTYLDSALEIYNNEFENIPNDIDFVHSCVKVENKKDISGEWNWQNFRRRMTLAHVGAFHNKFFFSKYGFYDETYSIAGDYELLLRAKEKLRTHQIKEITAIMSDGGISNKQVINAYKESTRAKIETGNVHTLVAKFDYNLWVLKYRVKQLLHAVAK